MEDLFQEGRRMKLRTKVGAGMFVLALPVAFCGSYLRDHFNVWEESGVTLYIFAGVYLFTAFILVTSEGPPPSPKPPQ